MITDINWPRFNVKFNEKQQKAFERLSYFLFCNEYACPGGIFRFKNQAGIETEPVVREDKVIGFQAKYYDESVAQNKNDLTNSLKKAKEKNPSLTHVQVYINRELGENPKKTKKKPVYQTEIESQAASIGIIIIWRVPSHLEKQLSLPENHYLAEYFFSTGTNLVDKLCALSAHSEAILGVIKTGIRYKNDLIHIKREFPQHATGSGEPNVTIVSGLGGCGKTAYIKEWFANQASPYYVFKATQFNINHIDQLFGTSNAITLNEFIEAHRQVATKSIIIDSAEKLSDLSNEDPFREFLLRALKNNWNVVFTTRTGYLEALEYLFMRILDVPFTDLRISILTLDELTALSEQYGFPLPSSDRVRQLLCNPFYLEEYLSSEIGDSGAPDLATFRDNLWRRKIIRADRTYNGLHIQRETCFLKLVKAKAEGGNFFLQPEGCSSEALASLCEDEIIAQDGKTGNYFIAHDIYEEWGLERLVGNYYSSRISNEAFFSAIGTSLPIRRAFRNWLIEGLEARTLYEFTIWMLDATEIEGFWQDEAIISILLTDYAISFFSDFKVSLLADKKERLKKMIFLLRIACKEPDLKVYNLFVRSGKPALDPAVFFSKPKGPGWGALYAFLFDNIKEFSIDDLEFILPVLKEWDAKFGPETLNVARFAYHFYDLIELDEEQHFPRETESELISILLNGAKEIKDELEKFFDAALTVQNGLRNKAYDNFIDAALTDHNQFIPVAAALPDKILQIADHLWYKPVAREHEFDFGGMGVEKYYSIRERWHNSYSPVSAYQTPLHWLLYFQMPKAVDFIIAFTNKTVAAYAKSGELESVDEFSFELPDGETITQFGTPSLWCMFRGYSSPTTPYLLECLHMALEKRLFEIVEEWKPENVRSWLIYILKNARSVSLTAVVSSVILAHYDKFFDVALSLFTGLDFYYLDSYRLQMEPRVKGLYRMGQMGDTSNRSLVEERLATCEEPHRSQCLETLIRNLQFFKSAETTKEQFDLRRDEILAVIDKLYLKADNISDKDEQINAQMLIARIDSRKMDPIKWQSGENTIIEFRPQLTPELQQAHEEAVATQNVFWHYEELKQWSEFHFDEGIGKNWPKYTDNPQLVIKEVKEIMEALPTKDESFYLRNHSIPAYACYALLKLHAGQLSAAELDFCKEILVAYAGSMIQENYNYQLGDGVEVAINGLPLFYPHYPHEVNDLVLLLVLCCLDDYPVGGGRWGDFVIDAIHRHLFQIAPEAAMSVFVAYCYFKPRFNQFAKRSSRYHARNFGHRRSQAILVHNFYKKNKKALSNIHDNHTQLYKEIDWSKLSLADWDTVMKFVPSDAREEVFTEFVKRAAIAVFPQLLISRHFRKTDERWDYALPHKFFKKYALFLIKRDNQSVEAYIKPLIDNFNISEEMADLFGEILDAADHHPNPEIFWSIWKAFYPSMVTVAGLIDGRQLNIMIHNYLLAWRWWPAEKKEWHTLREEDKSFIKQAAIDFGSHTATLYSIAKLMNDIGSRFLKDGITWLSKQLQDNPTLQTAKLETNTICYLESACRRYVFTYRTELRHHRLNAADVIRVLNFLISKASVSAYLLREDII